MSFRDEIRHTLRAHGIRLRKGLGQHFLADEGTYAAIVELAALRATR